MYCRWGCTRHGQQLVHSVGCQGILPFMVTAALTVDQDVALAACKKTHGLRMLPHTMLLHSGCSDNSKPSILSLQAPCCTRLPAQLPVCQCTMS